MQVEVNGVALDGFRYLTKVRALPENNTNTRLLYTFNRRPKSFCYLLYHIIAKWFKGLIGSKFLEQAAVDSAGGLTSSGRTLTLYVVDISSWNMFSELRMYAHSSIKQTGLSLSLTKGPSKSEFHMYIRIKFEQGISNTLLKFATLISLSYTASPGPSTKEYNTSCSHYRKQRCRGIPRCVLW